MSVVLKLTFPHRRYHATPWDQAVNNGVVEWPPSPWRIVRALIAVAYTRYPNVPMSQVLEAVKPLAQPPTYFVPPFRRGHTRHYMPKGKQRTGLNATELTFDPYVSVSPLDALVVEWGEAELAEDALRLLGELVASMPYLGRAESAVVGSIIDAPPQAHDWTGSIWRPSTHGLQRLMCPTADASREQLEVTVHQMRKGRRLLPEGARWVSYEEAAGAASAPRRRARADSRVEVMRWHFSSPEPFQGVNAVLATDRLRMIALSVTKPADDREDGTAEDRHPEPVEERDRCLLSGHQTGETRQHQHAHWLWTEKEGRVSDLVLWVPATNENGVAGVSYETAARVASVVGAIGLRPREDRGYVPTGFVAGDLNLVGWGGRDVIGDLLTRPGGHRGGTVWESATPHLLVRRGKKNQTLASLALEDVQSELAFRFAKPPAVRSIAVTSRPVEARLYRRLRWGAKLSRTLGRGAIHDRVPVWLRVEFAEPVVGPLVLGGLSHFGFGRLAPVE
ncbi:type I-G CRISPR-associated protein Csb2 [Propionicicella superfundia]|uniref:type I-G CRISPR-associated protein Csb2 n=1 Tax=Propionicicella superfundia TaxID=348582 RepID=UPI0003F60267|nr:type I-U CRISPR-associated protein Csb2 [Propionicicella superfundia]